MLKNDRGTLPLDVKSLQALAIIGPFANSTVEMMGGYSGMNLRIATHSPAAVLQHKLSAASPSTHLLLSPGAINGANRTDQISQALNTAKQADVTILFVGDTHVAEFSDRTWNGLEYAQEQLVKVLCGSGKPVVLVVIAGHSIDLTEAKQACSAILFAFLPSQFGGDAIADVLLGQYSPAGRLPITFYDRSVNERSNFNPEDMALRQGNGVTYQHYRGEALYEFGFGLSYSTFSFEWFKQPTSVCTTKAASADEDKTALRYHVVVTNTGDIAAGVAVLAFVNTSIEALSPIASGAVSMPSPPVRELFNFTRIFLKAGALAKLEFSLGRSVLALSDDAGNRAVHAGHYNVAIGGVGRAGHEEDGAVSASLELRGEAQQLFSLGELRQRHYEDAQ
eukprot:SAG31_NODE_5681_length_2384_cov_1.879212_3_plen_393_part_00